MAVFDPGRCRQHPASGYGTPYASVIGALVLPTAVSWCGQGAFDTLRHPIDLTQENTMQGEPQVIHFLQAQLKNELTAINQYFVHYRMFKHWGFERMAKKEYEESIGEMKHADLLMERLFTLDALPNLQDLGKLQIGETLVEALTCDLGTEKGSQATLKDGIAQAELSRDYVSRDLFLHILEDTEEHIDFLETQLELVGKVGEQNYLQTQMGS
jgi:bacterioferritin